MTADPDAPLPDAPPEVAGKPQEYPVATGVGPTGHPKCPKCGNSLQNEEPHGSPGLLRCATCKEIFQKPPEVAPAPTPASGGCPECGAAKMSDYDYACGSIPPNDVTPTFAQSDRCKLAVMIRKADPDRADAITMLA